MKEFLVCLSLGSLLLMSSYVAADEVKKEDLPRLMKDMKSGLPKVRADAARDIGHLGAIRSSDVKEAVPKLMELVKKDKDASVRKEAALALGKVDPDPNEAVPILMDALKDKAVPVRVAAAQALGELGPAAKEAVPTLRELQKDKDKEKRELSRAAGMAIRNINSGK